jgi:hypothetical protein
MSIQKKKKGEFELIIFTLLNVVHSLSFCYNSKLIPNVLLIERNGITRPHRKGDPMVRLGQNTSSNSYIEHTIKGKLQSCKDSKFSLIASDLPFYTQF